MVIRPGLVGEVVGRICRFLENERGAVIDRKLRDSILPANVRALLTRGFSADFVVEIACGMRPQELPFLAERARSIRGDDEDRAYFEAKLASGERVVDPTTREVAAESKSPAAFRALRRNAERAGVRLPDELVHRIERPAAPEPPRESTSQRLVTLVRLGYRDRELADLGATPEQIADARAAAKARAAARMGPMEEHTRD